MKEGFENINCPVCRNDQHQLFLNTFDRFAATKINEFQIVKCTNCGFIFLNPRPDTETASQYYDVDGYDPFLSADQSQSLRDKFYLFLRKLNLAFKFKKIRGFKPKPGKILDIGCATGEFLEKYQKHLWQCTGVEVAEKAGQIASAKNIKVFQSVHEIPDTEKFDLITMWHVLEHVHDLNETIGKIGKLIKKDGILVIAVPNIHSWDAGVYKSDWVALDAPRHLYHFSPDSIQKLLQKQNLKLRHKHTLLLDNLYNNLLSKNLCGAGFGFFVKNLVKSLVKTYFGSVDNSSSIVYYFSPEVNNE